MDTIFVSIVKTIVSIVVKHHPPHFISLKYAATSAGP